VTEQPDNQAEEPTAEAPAWVPADPEKSQPAAGGEPAADAEPTVVKPPVDPNAAVTPTMPVPPIPPPPVTPGAQSDGAATSPAGDRPEIVVGAAFAGGFALAMILKRLAR
jgi:hypothetical protein